MKSIVPYSRPSRGFSLVEVALAIAIVAIVVLAVVGLLVPAQRAIDDVLSGGQAGRLRQEVENEFSVLRPLEATATIITPFDKAYTAVKNSSQATGLYYAFFYRAKMPAVTNAKGRLEPYTDSVRDKRSGVDYLVQAAVMRVDEFKATSGYADAMEGKLFLLRFTPIEGLVADANAAAPFVKLAAYTGSGTPLADFIKGQASSVYPLAVIPVTVDFYAARDLSAPDGLLTLINKGTAKPLLSLNVGFNR